MARGILSAAGYVPHHRLPRAAVAALFGGAPGKGAHTVASYDEDTTTMGVAAARLALSAAPPGTDPAALWFATASPAYLDKTNATAIHAALRLDGDRPALDFGGAVRSGVGALDATLRGNERTLVVLADLRTGFPTGPDEVGGGDGAAAVLVGSDTDGPLLAEHLATGSVTAEFLDRWRTPGDPASRTWEERFGETQYVPLGQEAWQAALKAAALEPADISTVVITGNHARAASALAAKLGVDKARIADDLSTTVGNTGTAHPGLLLAQALEGAESGDVIALVVLADGADVVLFRSTDALQAWTPTATVGEQVLGGADLDYGKFLRWRGMVAFEPPRRPEPARPSASASARSDDWKFAFVGSRDRTTGAVHLPPSRVSMKGDGIDDMDPAPMADVLATVVTFTVDRLAYSPSPPIVFAVLDFDGGGRFACELADADPSGVAIGDRVEMTFRKLFTADGIHNYFWKARRVR